jgi:hypothetical protein
MSRFSWGERVVVDQKKRRKSKELHKYIHRYQLLWETKRTDLRVTEYHYPPFDQGERD